MPFPFPPGIHKKTHAFAGVGFALESLARAMRAGPPQCLEVVAYANCK